MKLSDIILDNLQYIACHRSKADNDSVDVTNILTASL